MRDIDAGGDHLAFLLQQRHRSRVQVSANALAIHHALVLGRLRAEGAAVYLLALWSSVHGALLERDAHTQWSQHMTRHPCMHISSKADVRTGREGEQNRNESSARSIKSNVNLNKAGL